MSDQERTIYDTTPVTPRAITAAEWEQLCEMFASDGWMLMQEFFRRWMVDKTLMATNSSVDEADRLRNCVASELFSDLVEFQANAKDAMQEAASDPDEEPPPPLQEHESPRFRMLFCGR